MTIVVYIHNNFQGKTLFEPPTFSTITFIIIFSPNVVANHTLISPITHLIALDPPYTSRPAWRPQLGSAILRAIRLLQVVSFRL